MDRKSQILSEDGTAAVVGLLVLSIALAACFLTQPRDADWQAAAAESQQFRSDAVKLTVGQEVQLSSSSREKLAKELRKSSLERVGIVWNAPAAQWIAKVGSWNSNPVDGFRKKATGPDSLGAIQWMPLVMTYLILSLIGAVAVGLLGQGIGRFLSAMPVLFLLTTLAYVLAAQDVIKYYNFEYPLWGLFVGMLVCNTVGTPKWLQPAVQGELYIKIGLVLLGAEVLLTRLLALGLPGVIVSWVVTPTVLITTYLFGQHVLKISSRSLNMVISADMSVCGVSAAIATGAACKAKKEELSLAIGISLAFTAIMMVVMPIFVQRIGLDPVVGGAWMGGTIDSTGAVVAAGETLGIVGSETAVTVKMIQNILIGVVAFGVAVYWTRWVEPLEESHGAESKASTLRMGLVEIWRRFPKFVLGFVTASLLCSTILAYSFFGESWIQTTTLKLTAPLRGWLFCLAFGAIGLSTNFRELAPYLKTGKPLVLYVCGQSFSLLLSLAMAYLMFGVVFRPEP